MKILLGVDGSTCSRRAVDALIEQFRPDSTEVCVVHAIEPISAYFSAEYFPHFVPKVEEIELDRAKEADALVDKVCIELAKKGFCTCRSVLKGDARVVLLDSAARWKPDLIVIGSHGLRGLNRLLMGSVSETVARHATCSVQIVRDTRSLKL